MQDKLHQDERADAGGYVVQNNSSTFGQLLQLPHWRRLHNIEGSKKYKTRQKTFPCHRSADERDQLARDFVNDDVLRIFIAGCARNPGCRGNTDRGSQNRERERSSRAQIGRQTATDGSPPKDGGRRSPGPRPGLQPANPKESRDQRCPERGGNSSGCTLLQVPGFHG
jgi:hypothetical protein